MVPSQMPGGAERNKLKGGLRSTWRERGSCAPAATEFSCHSSITKNSKPAIRIADRSSVRPKNIVACHFQGLATDAFIVKNVANDGFTTSIIVEIWESHIFLAQYSAWTVRFRVVRRKNIDDGTSTEDKNDPAVLIKLLMTTGREGDACDQNSNRPV